MKITLNALIFFLMIMYTCLTSAQALGNQTGVEQNCEEKGCHYYFATIPQSKICSKLIVDVSSEGYWNGVSTISFSIDLHGQCKRIDFIEAERGYELITRRALSWLAGAIGRRELKSNLVDDKDGNVLSEINLNCLFDYEKPKLAEILINESDDKNGHILTTIFRGCPNLIGVNIEFNNGVDFKGYNVFEPYSLVKDLA
jgi:hypothetical protein